MRLHWALAHLRPSCVRRLESGVGVFGFRLRTPHARHFSDQGESRTPKPDWARRSERRVSTCCTTWSCQFGHISDPCGNRTRLCGLRGRRPVPIDERADSGTSSRFSASGRSRTCTAVGRVGYSHLGTPMPGRCKLPVARVGFEPTFSRRFELRRFAGLRTVPFVPRCLSGFHPSDRPRRTDTLKQ